MKMTAKTQQKDIEQQPRKRIGHLKTAQDVARYMARLIRKAEKEEGGVTEFYKLTMMASMLLKAVEVSTLEERILKLEQKLQEMNDGKF